MYISKLAIEKAKDDRSNKQCMAGNTNCAPRLLTYWLLSLAYRTEMLLLDTKFILLNTSPTTGHPLRTYLCVCIQHISTGRACFLDQALHSNTYRRAWEGVGDGGVGMDTLGVLEFYLKRWNDVVHVGYGSVLCVWKIWIGLLIGWVGISC